MSWSARSVEGRSRRDVLKAFGAAAAGAVAGGVLKTDQAEASHGTINAVSSDENRPAIHAENINGGTGVEVFGGQSALVVNGDVYGVETTGDWGLVARGREIGVLARGSFGGVQAEGDVAVRAVGSEIGVSAVGDIGLMVEGSAKFSTSGSGTLSAGQDSAAVSNPAVTALSHVTVTLSGDPGQAGSAPGSRPVVVWVERQPGTGFVVHMSRGVRFATPFTYLIVEPV